MSLLHRTSSIESFGRRASSASQVDPRRPSVFHDTQQYHELPTKLNFGPLGGNRRKALDDELVNGLGAFEVSVRKRIGEDFFLV